MIQISGGKSALWWEQKRQMSGGKCDKLGGGKSDKGKWTTADTSGDRGPRSGLSMLVTKVQVGSNTNTNTI